MFRKQNLPRSITSLFSAGLWLGLGGVVFFFSVCLLSFTSLGNLVPTLLHDTFSYTLFSAKPEETGQTLGQFVSSEDSRVILLRSYLLSKGSPMADSASDFIQASDKYDLPWTLLPAIAGKESSFGKSIPKESFNPFGWAVFTGQQSGASFHSWQDSIFTVAKGIREKYFDRGLNTPALMEPYYTPPSVAKGHPWLRDVSFFMEEIESWQI